MKNLRFIIQLFVTLISTVLAIQPFEKVWENTQYQKTLDLSKTFVKERHDIEIKNIASDPQSQYIFALPNYLKEDISLVVVIAENPSGKRSLLQSKQIPLNDDDYVYYSIALPYPIAPKSDFKFTVSCILTNQMVPYPEHIPMTADQTLKVDTPAYCLSPYDTNSYSLRFINAASFETFGNATLPFEFDTNLNENSVVCKSSDVIPSNSIFDYSFTFTKTTPLTYVNYLKRDLWVSHWSNTLQLEEYYEVTNHGPKLDKGFSRAEYLNEKIGLKHHWSINALRIPFDKTKEIQENSIYFVDKVGNVSTSQFYNEELIVRPRFPLFGGWNYNFTIGWNYDLTQFLKQNNEEYILNAHILDGILDTTYGKINFNIYLPEGAEVIDYALPFGSEEPVISNEFSYLDIEEGHVKVSFEFENLVDEMKNLEIVLRYKYSNYNMIQKPLYAAFYLFLAFMGIYLLKVIDLSIKPNNKSDDVITDEKQDISEEEL